MPYVQDIDCDLVLRFAWQELGASDAFTDIFGYGTKTRLWQEHQVKSKPTYPFCVYRSTLDETIQWNLLPGAFVGKQRSELTIDMVRVYEQGAGDWLDFNAAFKAVRAALDGIRCLEVKNGGGDVVGNIHQSLWVPPNSKRARSEGDKQVLHYGMKFEVIHL